MEFGPRALGSRSILGDARDAKMQSVVNRKIKKREDFRPFAPSVLAEKADEYFELGTASPYMLLTAPVSKNIRKEINKKKLDAPRSTIPAVTHVDYSARIQTVHEETNPRYYRLIKKFEEKTGCAVVINTSFNIRGEPIVCTPEESYRCFMLTDMDVLAINGYILYKEEQPLLKNDTGRQDKFELD